MEFLFEPVNSLPGGWSRACGCAQEEGVVWGREAKVFPWMSEFVRICHIFTINGCGLKTNWKESSLENILTGSSIADTNLGGAWTCLFAPHCFVPFIAFTFSCDGNELLKQFANRRFLCLHHRGNTRYWVYVKQEGGQEKDGTFIGLWTTGCSKNAPMKQTKMAKHGRLVNISKWSKGPFW